MDLLTGRGCWGWRCPLSGMPPCCAMSCGCVCCSALINFLSVSTRASVAGNAISVQTHKVSGGAVQIEASPGTAKSGAAFFFLLDFFIFYFFVFFCCEQIWKTKAVSWPFFLPCLVCKDLCTRVCSVQGPLQQGELGTRTAVSSPFCSRQCWKKMKFIVCSLREPVCLSATHQYLSV